MEKLPADTLVWIKEGLPDWIQPIGSEVFSKPQWKISAGNDFKTQKRKKSEWTIHWLDQSNKIEKLMEQFVTNHPFFQK